MSKTIEATGRCYCGDIAFKIQGTPVMKGQCHCRPCRYITGGGPNYFMVFPQAAYTQTKGTVASFTRDDIADPRTRDFCPNCGTHMTTRNIKMGIVIVKVGTLDDAEGVYGGPKVAIHCKDIPGFHIVPKDVPAFDGLPPLPGE